MKFIKLLLCSLLIIEQASFPMEYVFAQESNKPFMADLGDEGGPMLDDDSGSSSKTSAVPAAA